MIVLVEGIDRVGKTTFAKKLEEAGFVYLKDKFFLDHSFVDNFADYSVGKCDSFLAMVEQLSLEGKNVVIDRLHFTELVYGEDNRSGDVNEKACWAIDMLLANMGAYLCYMKPSDIELSNNLDGTDQRKKSDLFDYYTKMSAMKTFTFDYNLIDDMVQFFVHMNLNYDFYFASPFFNEEQVEREERMIVHLRGLGFKVFSPKESCHLGPKADMASREEVFRTNLEAINNCKAVFAVTDGKDVGTIWEAGYAYGIKKPVIYYAETLGNNTFNLMLAQSGQDVYLNQEEVTYNSLIDSLYRVKREFRGDIE